jgi:hypothetical protein
MNKQTPSVEWTIAASDADWERLREPLRPANEPPAHRCRSLKRSFWRVAALLLLLAGAGDWWWRTTQAALPQPAANVTAPAQAALGTGAPGRAALVASVIADQTATDGRRQGAQADSSWRAAPQINAPAAHVASALPRIEVQGEQAMVSIVMTARNGTPAYRQTRFYQRTATDWRRTEPDPALWGPERSLETTFFVFHFRQHDAPAVIAVASQVDALHTTLWRNFGLPLTAEAEKLVIDVSVTQSPGQALYWYRVPVPLLVPSPARYRAPVELTDAELLAQSLALPLLEQVLAQASEHHAIGWSWQPLVKGLYLWQVWDLDLPLSAWRQDVVQWLYLDLLGTDPWQAVVLPERYPALCAAHRLWLPSPALMGIPLLCAEPAGEDRFIATWGPRHPLLRLDQLALSMPPDAYLGQSSASYVAHPGQTVALATLIEYAVVTYGREHLPTLVAGLGHYDTWDTLLPAVYGVSSAEFEAGWQAYLADHYAVPVDAAQ